MIRTLFVILSICLSSCCGSGGYEEYQRSEEEHRDWHISNLNRDCGGLQTKMRECGYTISREEICPPRLRGEDTPTGCISAQVQYLICAQYAGCTRGTRVDNCSREMEVMSLSCGGYSGF